MPNRKEIKNEIAPEGMRCRLHNSDSSPRTRVAVLRQVVQYLMPRLHRLLHDDTSWQPGGTVKVQSVQELLPDHLHGLFKTLLRKQVQQYGMSVWMENTAEDSLNVH